MPRRCRQSGFTLLELIVATAVFAVMGVLAYGGLQRVLEIGDGVRVGHQQLARLQTALILLRQDLHFASPRAVRDALGDPRPVFVGGGDLLAELCSQSIVPDGWAQDPGVRRIAYRLRGDTLVRQVWPVLDRAPGIEPREVALLEGVTGARMRYLDEAGEWHVLWPPAGAESRLPRGIEFSLQTRRFGAVRRVIVVG